MPRARGDDLSQDTADLLIRDLIWTGRAATAEEIDRITQRMASSPFPALRAHLARRLIERQWIVGTTEQEYVDDLRRAIRDDAARVAVYRRRGGNLAAVLAPSERILPTQRRGARWLPVLFVVYSADRDIILSGYQASSLRTIALPEDIRWLR